MTKKIIYLIILTSLAVLVFASDKTQMIMTGIAIFLIGMIFMEDGFKFFSGGFLQKLLEKSTNTLTKAIFTGFVSTTIVQSSSLVSIITISFLTAQLISLVGAIGIIFGSNIGTTSTAWIISTLGMKVNIATLAMPMIIFGVVFKLFNEKNIQGIGNILIGVGFIFLGIEYMKDGFDTLKNSINLATYSIEGILGIFVFVLIGIIATVIIQSSSATMALIITAVAAGQITYINAIELAIGANIGTTITALIASLASNSNGKRLAIAHLIFNFVTAFVAIVCLPLLVELVDFLADKLTISSDDYAMKLALFHTIFNVLGVLIVTPFTSKLVKFLQTLFSDEKVSNLKALYLDEIVIRIPDAAINSLRNENIHLLDNAIEVISHGLFLHRHKFLGSDDLTSVVKNANLEVQIDVNEFYTNKIKFLYGEIIHYATLAQDSMNDDDRKKVYQLKLASRDIVEAIKDIRELQKNLHTYLNSNNESIKDEYSKLRILIAKCLKYIYEIKNSEDEEIKKNKLEQLNSLKNEIENSNDRIDSLIRMNQITSKMATSLINDNMFTQSIINRLIDSVNIIYAQ